jgi:hypothetical protein
VVEQRAQITARETYIRDLEDYIDNLLVKVMETQPKLLQNPYVKQNGGSSGVSGSSSSTSDLRANNRVAAATSTSNEPPRLATLSPGVYLANSRNREITTTFTGIVTQGVKNSKSSQRSANGNPLKFIHSLISTK